MRTNSRNAILLGALCVAALAVPALAQQPSGASKYAECPANFQASQGEQDAAHGAYLAGKAAYDEADYGKAIDYFKDAFKRDCTKTALLNFIARAYEAKGDRAEAVNALETYLARTPKADDADQVKKRIENLKAQMSAATATAPTNTGTPTTTATTTATTAPTTTSTATAAPTATDTAPSGGGHTVLPWVVAGVGLAAAIGGGVVLGVGAGDVSDAGNKCPNKTCPVTYTPAQIKAAQDENNNGKTLEGVGIGVLVGGVVLLAGGLIWHFLEPTGEKKTAITPVFSPSFAGLSLERKF